MQKIDYKELDWPKGLNLEQLVSLLPEDVLRKFIVANCHLERSKRRIILPSLKCCKKILAHRLWKKIEDGESTWEIEKEILQKEFGSLVALGITKWWTKKLYIQREKEILKEKKC